MLVVEGRVLPAETILFAGGVKGSYNPKTGQATLFLTPQEPLTVSNPAEWSNLTKNSPLIDAVHVSNWLLVFFEKNATQANDFAEKLRQVGASVSLKVDRPEMIQLKRDMPTSYLEAIKVLTSYALEC